MNGSLSFCGDCLPRLGSIIEFETLSGIINTFNQKPRQRLLTNPPSLSLASSFASISLTGLAFDR